MRLMLSSKGLANKELTENFIRFVGSKRKVSIITTASQIHKEKNTHTIILKSQLDDLGFITCLVDIEFEDPEILRLSEILIITGGNPYYLLHHIHQSKSEKVLHELIAQQIPVWGISAGFMILMKDLDIIDLLTPEMNTLGLHDKSGLGLIEEIVIPHYDRFIKEGKISKEEIDTFEADSERRIVRLGEFQCLNYEGNRFEKIGLKM